MTKDGLYYRMVYTVLGVKTLSTGQRLVRMRTSLKEHFTGHWSHTSSKWTQELKEEVNLKSDMTDGIFYMSIEQYHHVT